MALSSFLEPWRAPAYRHIPRGSAFDALDFRYAGRGATNRWNEPGEPTLYLAGDPALAGLEFFRHLAVDRDAALAAEIVARTVYRLDVAIERVIDLRREAVQKALSLSDAPACFLDIRVARAAAGLIRYGTPEVQGIVVPSVAALDQPDRWTLVLFLDRLPADVRTFIRAVAVDSTIEFGPPK